MKKNEQEWSEQNNQSWEGHDIVNENGLTNFQISCLEALKKVIDSSDKKINGEKETYITGTIPGTSLKYFIYEDGAEISGEKTDLRFERWDFNTRETLINEFINEFINEVSAIKI